MLYHYNHFLNLTILNIFFLKGDINKEGFLDKTCKIAELVDFDCFYQEPFLGSAGNRVTECKSSRCRSSNRMGREII